MQQQDSINTLCVSGHLVGTPAWKRINNTRYLRWVVEVDDGERSPFEVPVLVDSPLLGRLLCRMKPGSRVVVVGKLQVRAFGEPGGPSVRLYARALKPYNGRMPKKVDEACAQT